MPTIGLLTLQVGTVYSAFGEGRLTLMRSLIQASISLDRKPTVRADNRIGFGNVPFAISL
jgi:hypothetical protein